MYLDKLVACVKVNDKICREQGSIVHIPFGSQYELYFKNLESRKCLVNVEIDGREVIKGLLINPNSTSSVKRFVEGYGHSQGPSLKFIEKTQEISDFRGDKIEDGLIRVEFQFEKEKPIQREVITTYTSKHCYMCNAPYYYEQFHNCMGCLYRYNTPWVASGYSSGNAGPKFARSMSMNADMSVGNFTSNSFNDSGITVEGSKNNQSFTQGYIGTVEEQKHTIILQLKGYIGEVKVQEPLTIKTKVQCHTCGKKNSSNSKFCGNCGTNLEF